MSMSFDCWGKELNVNRPQQIRARVKSYWCHRSGWVARRGQLPSSPWAALFRAALIRYESSLYKAFQSDRTSPPCWLFCHAGGVVNLRKSIWESSNKALFHCKEELVVSKQASGQKPCLESDCFQIALKILLFQPLVRFGGSKPPRNWLEGTSEWTHCGLARRVLV